ncbi:hypothetical protein ACFVYJ_01405 [Pontibacter sp. JAM-7]|uniref:hypothetical protein n=1 Tax=Pontibacter sp. JAM-7 TaxID=3366581 RepID=UPI003AF97951
MRKTRIIAACLVLSVPVSAAPDMSQVLYEQAHALCYHASTHLRYFRDALDEFQRNTGATLNDQNASRLIYLNCMSFQYGSHFESLAQKLISEKNI